MKKCFVTLLIMLVVVGTMLGGLKVYFDSASAEIKATEIKVSEPLQKSTNEFNHNCKSHIPEAQKVYCQN